MPVKIWEADEEGLSSRVESNWQSVWTPEQYRDAAEELDELLDGILDRTVERVAREGHEAVPPEFLRAWAIGRELLDSRLFKTNAMQKEQPKLLWKALARKCRLGARHNGDFEPSWAELRPKTAREPRREGGQLDYFEMCRWLAEQSLDDAVETFGGQIRNVWQMLERPTLRPFALRTALLEWIRSLPVDERGRIYERETFADLMKTLRRRWPDRGPGSAKRPVHYAAEDLAVEVARTLADFSSGIPRPHHLGPSMRSGS